MQECDIGIFGIIVLIFSFGVLGWGLNAVVYDGHEHYHEKWRGKIWAIIMLFPYLYSISTFFIYYIDIVKKMVQKDEK